MTEERERCIAISRTLYHASIGIVVKFYNSIINKVLPLNFTAGIHFFSRFRQTSQLFAVALFFAQIYGSFFFLYRMWHESNKIWKMMARNKQIKEITWFVYSRWAKKMLVLLFTLNKKPFEMLILWGFISQIMSTLDSPNKFLFWLRPKIENYEKKSAETKQYFFFNFLNYYRTQIRFLYRKTKLIDEICETLLFRPHSQRA